MYKLSTKIKKMTNVFKKLESKGLYAYIMKIFGKSGSPGIENEKKDITYRSKNIADHSKNLIWKFLS